MQFRDLGAQYRALKPEIDAGIQTVIDSTGFILGKPVTELENKLAEYVGRKHCVSCANGTDCYLGIPKNGICCKKQSENRIMFIKERVYGIYICSI